MQTDGIGMILPTRRANIAFPLHVFNDADWDFISLQSTIPKESHILCCRNQRVWDDSNRLIIHSCALEIKPHPTVPRGMSPSLFLGPRE